MFQGIANQLSFPMFVGLSSDVLNRAAAALGKVRADRRVPVRSGLQNLDNVRMRPIRFLRGKFDADKIAGRGIGHVKRPFVRHGKAIAPGSEGGDVDLEGSVRHHDLAPGQR